MRKTPIKVKLQHKRLVVSVDTGKEENLYRVTKIDGAITVGSYNGQIIRAGDHLDEKQAEHLTRSYLITVTT